MSDQDGVKQQRGGGGAVPQALPVAAPGPPTAPTPVAAPHNKRPTIIIYPTVSPESVVIPIVSGILGFPLLALLVICCLRRRAKLARERDRRRAGNCVYLAGPTGGRNRAVSLRSERAMSRAFPSLELDTVIEERSDPETTGIEPGTPDS
ncbi:uncharacterized protein LOC111046473 isoform X2 [Nilaparvata lugens]|uniref:uncharacterized protein LOC111046473 isoform X2 n=1 Tax=Nilaparvata lugens TaxID=108931 RepID=UPI00193D6959|nr:uncharacterized protein LOC111046473 isoform X2 [Nilaparvata lugens]